MISVRGVSKIFGSNTAVNDISFEVAAGEHFILLGTSGCGKTTILKMINRLIDPTSGQISVNKKNSTDQPAEILRRSIGYVLQRNSLFPHYTVYENIAVVPGLLRWDKDKTDRRINELTAKLHLSPELLHVYPGQLSGGEAQRVNLARALVADPPILLMDEPFSALDNITRSAIRNEFLQLDELKKKTIIMVTHDVQEAFEMGDCICLMNKGNIMQTGTPKELLFNPANDFVRGFLSDAYMQLSLTVTTLQDVWPDLVTENVAIIQPAITADITIWKALEQLKDKNDKSQTITIQHPDSKEVKQTSWAGILSAFSSYQKR